MGPVGWLGGYFLAAAATAIFSVKLVETVFSEANDVVKGAVFRIRLDNSSDARGDARLHEVSARAAGEYFRCSK